MFRIWIGIISLTIFSTTMRAATIVWNVGSGTDTNWSDGANWVGGVAPGGGDDVKFFDTGAATTPGVISNVVDVSFGGYIGTLQYGQSNGFHTTLISPGLTLSITNGGLSDGSVADPGAAKLLTNTIAGAGATLYLSNLTGNISVNQTTAASGANRANLDLSGLDNLVISANRIGIGDGQFPGVAVNNHAGGNLLLAKTNFITLAYTDTLVNYQTNGKNSAIILSRNSGNNPGIGSFLQLGIANVFNVDSMNFGMDKSQNNSANDNGVMLFNPVFAGQTLTANFFGAGGPGTRVTWWSVGDGNSSASSSNGGGGTNDFSLGTVNALVNVMSLGRDAASSSDAFAGTHKGVFTFTNGTVDVNTLTVGNQYLESGASTTPSLGIFNVAGPGAVLKVNTLMTLGTATETTAAGINTSGNLNVTKGTVYANTIAVGVNSVTNTIKLLNGTLIVSNTIATNVAGLFNLTISNSTLGLTVPANSTLRGLVKTLNVVGPTNLIQLDPNPVVFPVYPTNISLIRYTTWTGSNVFGLASVPPWAPNATIVSNGPNLTVDLSLPTSPAPIITGQPTGYSGSPGDNVTTNFAVVVADGSGAPLSYFWYFTDGATFTNLLSDGFGPSGISTISNTATANMVMTNAQTGDNGSYFVVVSNIYGVVTSSVAVLDISSGCVPPSITGPNNETVIQGNNATFTATVAANPAAYLQWQSNGVDIAGANNSTLVVTDVQYPANDQTVYSLIATNSCGDQTNSAILSVTVPPVITNQPTSLVVTNTQSASFTVVAGGVEAPTYQWYKNTTANPILNATNATFNIASTSPSDTATYFVKVINSAGSVTSTNVTLTVNSTMAAVSLTPANGSSGICYDTPLTIIFDRPPTLNNIGTVKIYNVTNPATPVDTVDMTLGNPQGRTIAGAIFNSFAVIINGNTAVIYPHLDLLTSNQTYYVTVDDGVFKDSVGAFFAGVTAGNWQFTTKVAGPVDPVNPVVAADGSGDFLTVQGSLDSLPTSSPSLRVIHINNGTYVELVNLVKSNLTVRGQSRAGTVVEYANNNNINPSTGTRMAFHVNTAFVALENLTIVNTTPQGGSQAEALMVDSPGNHFILNNAEVDSRQDTILVNSGTTQAYFYDSLIQGNFDYIWGGGNLFVTNCQIQTIGGTGTPNLAAPRTPNAPPPNGNWPGYLGNVVSNGFSFVQCQLTGTAGVTNCSMSDHNGQTNGQVAYINCNIDTSVYTNADATAQTSQLLWEFGCTDRNNNPLDNTASPFLSFSQLTPTDARYLAAINVTIWLNGWTPSLLPNITSQPGNQTVNANQQATFTVAATGIPDPTYQWMMNGTNVLIGQTNTTLIITNANGFDIGSYAAVVSNGAGSVTSSVVTLSVIPPATGPTLLTPAVQGNGNVQFSISGAPGAAGFGYRLWASTNIALTPITSTWTLLTNDVFGTSPTTFIDTTATTTGAPQRFYVITVP